MKIIKALGILLVIAVAIALIISWSTGLSTYTRHASALNIVFFYAAPVAVVAVAGILINTIHKA